MRYFVIILVLIAQIVGLGYMFHEDNKNNLGANKEPFKVEALCIDKKLLKGAKVL